MSTPQYGVTTNNNNFSRSNTQTSSRSTHVLCGPLLNYRRISNIYSSSPTWHGSILVVVAPQQGGNTLEVRSAGRADASGSQGQQSNHVLHFQAERLYADHRASFWRYSIEVPVQEYEARWTYQIPGLVHFDTDKNTLVAKPKAFVVPASSQSMRIMFHSCNGFSVGTDEEAWSGPALWNDVLRQHQERPIHVMIGGGDQVYNDGIRVSGPLKEWTEIQRPRKRREYQFDEKLRAKSDEWYFQNYVQWYSTRPFADANCTIPQINIWDDHDIIDGFGSYTDHFMRCHVFRGIGGIALKYYLLFQHHLVPPRSTYTTDASQTHAFNHHGVDPVQAEDRDVVEEQGLDPSYIVGPRSGPYINHKSMSIFTQLGPRIALLALDARMERTRHQINYDDTYDLVFRRVEQELKAASGQVKHLILLLGVPIAYPRLQWLENILRLPIIAPIKLLNSRFGFGGDFFNQFDGSVDLLDDLDDHYANRHHKQERKDLILRLQRLAQQHSLRITILSGDVHLAAFGRFYSRPELGIPPEQDFRYIVNIISSAITNHPPPAAVANLLARRNKIHHLDEDTDETLLNLFDHDPGTKSGATSDKKSASSNHCTMPSRNYALISESTDHTKSRMSTGNGVSTNGVTNGNGFHNVYHVSSIPANGTNEDKAHHNFLPNRKDGTGNPRDPITEGEIGCGTEHPAASGLHMTGLCGEFGLDVAYRVEIDHSKREGWTDGYGLSIPALDMLHESHH